MFDAALTNPPVHRLQHFSFFATAILFWWALIWRSDYGPAAWHLFFTMIHTSVLGALMALAPPDKPFRSVDFAARLEKPSVNRANKVGYFMPNRWGASGCNKGPDRDRPIDFFAMAYGCAWASSTKPIACFKPQASQFQVRGSVDHYG